jgi:hypothetical protein
MARPKGSTLSAEHKTALSAGRKMASIVSNYLEALEASKPKRGAQAHQRLHPQPAGHDRK